MMPETILSGPKTRDMWTQDIIKEFEKMELNTDKKTAQQVKHSTIDLNRSQRHIKIH